jgi:hypothetical protein
MTYVADGANLSQLIDGQLSPDAEGMSLFPRFSEATGYKQKVTSCEKAAANSDTIVRCALDFDDIRSDEIGRGPYPGRSR